MRIVVVVDKVVVVAVLGMQLMMYGVDMVKEEEQEEEQGGLQMQLLDQGYDIQPKQEFGMQQRGT